VERRRRGMDGRERTLSGMEGSGRGRRGERKGPQ